MCQLFNHYMTETILEFLNEFKHNSWVINSFNKYQSKIDIAICKTNYDLVPFLFPYDIPLNLVEDELIRFAYMNWIAAAEK